jgi:hypothetical protein
VVTCRAKVHIKDLRLDASALAGMDRVKLVGQKFDAHDRVIKVDLHDYSRSW